VIPQEQAEVAALLRKTSGAAPIETHISAVFVGPEAAWKLKKAVALGFLDFTAQAARAHFLRRELKLNSGFAPGLYQAVVPVTRGTDGALRLGGDGLPVEHVLRMAPIPADAFLDRMAEREGLSPDRLEELADVIVACHAGLAPAKASDFNAVIRGNAAAAIGAGLPTTRVAAWGEAALATHARIASGLAARASAGRVRRCHGDLHLSNLCLWQGRITPFDALEFDEALATIDTGYDLAFLLMDLEHRLGRAAANRVLNRYVARAGDAGLVVGLPLWLSLRAMIRAHVTASQGADGLPYLHQAEAMLCPPPPRLIAIGGLPGTGKSRLARALAPEIGAAPGALVLRSDEIRKRQAGVAPERRLGSEAYLREASDRVFAELNAAAEAALAGGHAVVADAAFLRPEERNRIAGAAGATPFTGLWLTAPLDVLRSRVAERVGDASDAGVGVLEAAAQRPRGPLDWAEIPAAADPVPAARARLGLPD
jgi:uncharacterized protein